MLATGLAESGLTFMPPQFMKSVGGKKTTAAFTRVPKCQRILGFRIAVVGRDNSQRGQVPPGGGAGDGQFLGIDFVISGMGFDPANAQVQIVEHFERR